MATVVHLKMEQFIASILIFWRIKVGRYEFTSSVHISHFEDEKAAKQWLAEFVSLLEQMEVAADMELADKGGRACIPHIEKTQILSGKVKIAQLNDPLIKGYLLEPEMPPSYEFVNQCFERAVANFQAELDAAGAMSWPLIAPLEEE